MYTFAIVLSVVCLIGFLVSLFFVFTSIGDGGMACAFALLAFFIIVGFIGLALISIYKPAAVEKLDLIAMYSDQEIDASGRSILGSGHFVAKENGVYRYYYCDEDGGIRQGSAKAEDSVIYEIDDTEIAPYVVVTIGGNYESYEFYVPANEWTYRLD